MSGGDYILALLTIITGLAISDLVVSFHELLINRTRVVWDWLTLLAAGFVLVLIANSWRISFAAFRSLGEGPPVYIFLLSLGLIIPMYLAARAVLPDKVDGVKRLDLAAHYDGICRYLWAAVACSMALFLVIQVLRRLKTGQLDFPQQSLLAGVMLLAALVLTVWPRRSVHRWVVPAAFVLLAINVLPSSMLSA